ncbi:MAG: hypothetical protein K6G32_13545 [Prevotella sp.]|nr:hypothetical protein [Prevotella sp.]
MERCKLLLLSLLCMTVTTVASQSFESLKRSKGKTELYSAVEKTLSGQMTVSQCKNIIASAKDFTEPYGGKTPIYLILDYLATHPKSQCDTAEQLLEAFTSRRDFDINLRYSTLLPPMAYLIRENQAFLKGKFSRDYISNKVLRLMIEKGALVNTYGEDGASLMAFAMDTGNDYLQTYFIDKGLDAHHEDEKGHDDLYKLIERGDLTHLKQLIARNTALDINLLKNDPKTFARFPELYDFVARHCADKAQNYEDVTLFQKKFSDRRSLVRNKYENLCRKESDAATDYFQLMKCVERYPDLSAITNPRKLAIYRQDCKFVQDVYSKVCAKAAALNIYASMPYEGRVTYFLDAYDKNHYDPDQFVQKARDVNNVYAIGKAVGIQIGTYYYGTNFPTWEGKRVEKDKAAVKRGLDASKQPCTNALSGFFGKASTYLQDKYDNLIASVNSQYERFRQAEKAAEARRQSERRAERAAQEDWNKKMKSDDAGYYITQKVSDWGEWSGWRIIDSDDDFEDSRTVKFSDGKTVSLRWEHRKSQGIDHYGFSPRGLFNGMRWYTNFNDAVIGAYMDKYENQEWRNGRE